MKAHELAIAGGPQLDVLYLPAAMRHRDHVLGAGFDPLHRPAELSGRCGHDDELGSRAGLRAEPAAHVADDHADVSGRQAER